MEKEHASQRHEDPTDKTPMVVGDVQLEEVRTIRKARYKSACKFLRHLSEQDDDYDEKTWPILEQELTDSGVRCLDADETSA